jgi:DNA-binding NarL/FixJ family response regulator
LLVADDDEVLLEAAIDLLRKHGYSVTAVTGRDGVFEALETESYDVLISDVRMPGNDRLEMLHELRKTAPSLPVVLMTGYPSLPGAIDALRLQAVDYLRKPFEPDELLDAVAEGVKKTEFYHRIDTARRSARAWANSLEQVIGDQSCRPQKATDSLPDDERCRLSPREIDVVEQLARGHRVADVALVLSISPHTVRTHLKSIFRKLDVESQLGLMAKLRSVPN